MNNEIKEVARRLKSNIHSATMLVEYQSYLAACERDIEKLIKLISTSEKPKNSKKNRK